MQVRYEGFLKETGVSPSFGAEYVSSDDSDDSSVNLDSSELLNDEENKRNAIGAETKETQTITGHSTAFVSGESEESSHNLSTSHQITHRKTSFTRAVRTKNKSKGKRELIR